MTDISTSKPKGTFWVIAILALIWNLLGVMAYLGQVLMSEETLAALPEEQQELYTNVPTWATAAFALAVWCGFLGSIFLVIRKKLAKTFFLVSLLGILVQMVYNFFLSKNIEVYGPGGYIMPVMVIIIGVFLVWYSKDADSKGYLR